MCTISIKTNDDIEPPDAIIGHSIHPSTRSLSECAMRAYVLYVSDYLHRKPTLLCVMLLGNEGVG